MSQSFSPKSDDVDVTRADTRYVRLREGGVWVQKGTFAGRVIRERFGPRVGSAPPYIPVGREVEVIKDLIQESFPVVISGPPGTGKTSLIRAVFHELGIPLQTHVCSAATTEAELFGRMGVGGEKGELTVWKDGKLSLASRAAAAGVVNGFYLDEVIKLPPSVASCLYSLLDHRRTLTLPTGEELEMGANLKIVLSFNPSPDTRLEEALRSRLTAIRLGYAPAPVEVRVLLDRRIGGLVTVPGGEDIATALVAYANVIRHAFGYRVGGGGTMTEDHEVDLLRRLPSAPSTRSLVVVARMIARSLYSPWDSVVTFLIPSLLQDTHDFALRDLEDLLLELADRLLPKISPFSAADPPEEELPPAADPLVERQATAAIHTHDLLDGPALFDGWDEEAPPPIPPPPGKIKE